MRVLARGTLAQDLAGRRIVISAGGTREEIDPVRFIGNWSSGTQGYALARTAVARGAEVTVVAANVGLADPAGAKVVHVTSALQMQEAVTAAAGPAVLVGFAAETDPSAPAAQAKLASKGCDLLVVNPVGGGLAFGTADNEAVVYGADGTVTPITRGPKEALADVVWDLVTARLK
jgi:phosphopantothenoylcysteine decarboxylase/phosphopantothenate--cysteine ligase